MKQEINHKLLFTQTPQEVWEYLTKPELMEQWLMPNNFKPIVGYQFQFNSKPKPELNFDGIFYCTVLEVIPLKKLTYSWKSGPGENKVRIDSIVEWVLNPKDNGTELVLKHSGFSIFENLPMYAGLNDGWLKNMHKIATLLNNNQHGTTNA
jgi:uncharacterized protein YndB with AHSA1/START domain